MPTTRITITPDATPEERAALWASLSKRERLALLRAMQTPTTTSADRQQAVAALRERAGGR